MSALASLETFPNMFADKEEKDLFARCITGYQYQGELGYEDSIRNIIISLLNSSTIDVDKLDYLIRDSFVSGYDSVQIDYERLLSGITVLPPEGRLVQYRLAYNKTALGILENVIYARDFEREWVQAHPVIMYEAFLLQHAMRQAQKHVATRGARLFSKEALTEKGVSFSDSIDELNENRSIRLLSDDDLYYLTKNEVKDDSLIYELYCRASRRHPIWKSEAEYQAIKNLIGTKPLEHLERILLDMEERLIKEFGAAIIERSTLEALQDMIENKIPCSEILDEKEKRAQINDITDYIKICEALLSFEREGEVEPSYAIISVKHFKSGFYGSVLGDTLVAFPHIKRNNGKNIVSYKLSEVCPLLSRDGQVDSNFFYLYYRRGAAEKEAFPLRSFVKMLSDLASQLWG